MFIRKTTKRYKDKTYSNYLVVETLSTPQGPRQRTICSLGNLAPGPKSKWPGLIRQVEASLSGQTSLEAADPLVSEVAARVRQAAARHQDLVSVHTDQVRQEKPREAGPVHVGHQMWQRLGLDDILEETGLSPKVRRLTEIMVLNRLVAPCSEHAMPDWVRRTALGDILGMDLEELTDEALYRNLDRLHPNRGKIEAALASREKTLFNLDDTYFFYDLTSTYFEGQCASNPQAQRGYSRDQRPDCKQVVIGLVLDREGFPKAHEIFEGNRQDCSCVDEMLGILEQRIGRQGGGTVIVDRGMAFDDNLQQIQARGHHYVVACRQSERKQWLEELEQQEPWQEILREPSPNNPAQKKSRVWVKRLETADQLYILCRSQGRQAKDQAIREKQEKRLLNDLGRLHKRVANKRIQENKIHEAIGRLKERYPRVARYYRLCFAPDPWELSWQEDSEAKARAVLLDGTYLLKTDRKDLDTEEAWRIYILLTRVEDAFRDLKSPLRERPIFHQLKNRVQTHIFVCVLAYHLLISIETSFQRKQLPTSWATLRNQLSTHQVVTVVLPTAEGRLLQIRKGTTPEKQHRLIYDTLDIPHEVMAPVKTWLPNP